MLFKSKAVIGLMFTPIRIRIGCLAGFSVLLPGAVTVYPLNFTCTPGSSKQKIALANKLRRASKYAL
jgi:hypothetical protein